MCIEFLRRLFGGSNEPKADPPLPTIEVDGFNLLPKDEVCDAHQIAADSHAYWADAQEKANNQIPNVGDVEHHYYFIDVHLSGKWYLEHPEYDC